MNPKKQSEEEVREAYCCFRVMSWFKRYFEFIVAVLITIVLSVVIFFLGKALFKKAVLWFISCICLLIATIIKGILSYASGIDH